EKQAIRKEENGGKPAVTKYEVQQVLNCDANFVLNHGDHPRDQNSKAPPAKFSFVKLWPKTGRTHQLRVHMTAIGFPMVGDTMYGGRDFHAGDFRFERQALH